MRNLDLDQYWPIPTRGASDAAREMAPESVSPPPISRATAPPPLPLAHDEPEAQPDVLAAASAGWLDEPPLLTPSASLQDDSGAMRIVAVETAPTPRSAANEPSLTAREAMASQTEPSKTWNLTPVIWGGSGFIAGMLAWHVVGFWSFVSNVVLNANDPRAQTLEAFLPKLAPHGVQQASRPVTDAGKALAQPAARQAVRERKFACVALALDRGAGGTTVSACPQGTAHLRDAGFNKRADKLTLKPRLQDPVAWTGTTAVQVSAAAEEAPEQAPSNAHSAESGTLSESDLKLDLTPSAMKIER